jgi:hypothetical protein
MLQNLMLIINKYVDEIMLTFFTWGYSRAKVGKEFRSISQRLLNDPPEIIETTDIQHR